MGGLKKPDRYGEIPLIGNNPETPNEKYFERVDQVINRAGAKGLYIGLLPTWGDKVTPNWGAGLVTFNVRNAYAYGRWIGNRYKHYPNILWILGGDRPAIKDTCDWRPIWRAMANGILDGTNHQAFITYHPPGGFNSTSQYIHNESWLTMNMIQSGHGAGHDSPTWELITRDFNLLPHKPVLDAEPNYKDHPANPWPKYDPANGYYSSYDVRKQLYRSVFAGACGATYGHHSVWQFYSPDEEKINYSDRYWTDALDRPGAFQAGYLLRLMGSRPSLKRVSDDQIITEGQGDKGGHSTAFYDGAGTYLMVYLPVGKKVSINPNHITGESLSGCWFNPRNGKALYMGKFSRSAKSDFTPPDLGMENDWVLVLDNIRFHYGAPGLKTVI